MLDPCVRCMCVCVCVCVCCISDVSVYLDVYDVYRIYESDVSAYRYLGMSQTLIYNVSVYIAVGTDVSVYIYVCDVYAAYMSLTSVPTDI